MPKGDQRSEQVNENARVINDVPIVPLIKPHERVFDVVLLANAGDDRVVDAGVLCPRFSNAWSGPHIGCPLVHHVESLVLRVPEWGWVPTWVRGSGRLLPRSVETAGNADLTANPESVHLKR